MTDLVTLDDVRAAHDRIRDTVLRTPLVPYPPADPRRPLWLKAESLQPTGAFKIRGALNTILLALDRAREHGVVTHSSGNHGRAVAWVARESGVRATVVMPQPSPPIKIAAVRALGATVELVAPDERESRAAELAADGSAVLVPPYDHPDVVAGQGTVGLEVVADLPDVDVVLVPVGGGGLVAGVAATVKALRPRALVVGVEPELAADAAESLRTGTRVSWPSADTHRTIADGLRVPSLGDIGWAHVQAHVDDVVTVTEAEIRAAMFSLAVDARLVAEPSGAVTLAAYLHRRDHLPAAGRYVAVLSGGSVDPAVLADVLTTGGGADA